MDIRKPAFALVVAGALCAGAAALSHAQQIAEAVAVPFSDPARLGSLRVALVSGGIVVKGGSRKDVLVSSRSGDGGRRRPPEPPPGLRRLTQTGGLTIIEEHNEITVGAGPSRRVDVEAQVPNRINLDLTGVNGPAIVVENVDGEIEVSHVNGGIRLTNVAGSVVADSHNGDVVVRLTRLSGDKPMAFTSFNGNVDVTLPSTAKANLKLRSENGDVYTDFDVQLRPETTSQTTRRGGRIRVDLSESLYGSINGGGPEFELRTFNGDIYVRKGAP